MTSDKLEHLYYEAKPYLLIGFALAALGYSDLAKNGYIFCGILLAATSLMLFQRARYRRVIKIKPMR